MILEVLAVLQAAKGCMADEQVRHASYRDMVMRLVDGRSRNFAGGCDNGEFPIDLQQTRHAWTRQT